MRILLVHGVGRQERPDNQPWERPWEEAITAGIEYFDPAFAPTGVFTYALAKEFRKAEAARETDLSFAELSERVNATMKTLRYDQISDVKRRKVACNAPVLGSRGKTRSR
jgi:hypothetical protein